MTRETAVIVGVRSLGRVVARHFGKLGFEVVCAARTADTVEAVAKEVDAAGGKGVPFVCDLFDPASLRPLGERSLDLVISAQTAGGRFGAKPLLEIDDAEIDANLRAYVRGTWNLLKAVGPRLTSQRRGTFLQIGTSSGVRTKDGFAALGASQHALRALVQVAAKEWRANSVHVAYLPIDGAIESERTKEWIAKNGPDRAVDPQAIAQACEFLHRQPPRSWTHELLLRPIASDWTTPT
jgi:NAD(P)-dependent dehydrogenase (short-subunit alcohol dehydrogenase family)